MLSLTTSILSLFSAAISSSTGATILQGPHHSAQKSTSTGLSLCRTSVVKSASVVFLVAPIGSPRGSSDVWCNRSGWPAVPRAGLLRREPAVPTVHLRAVRRVGGHAGVEADVRLRRRVLLRRQVALG